MSFGAANATSFSITSDTSLTAITPPGTGIVAVSVTNASGVSAAAGAFTYQATAPTVSSLSLGTGPATGGSSITILGANLNGASAVKFGSVAATSFTINSPTSITAVAPAQAAGTVQVTVTTPNGTSATSGASQFQYVNAAAPTVTAVTPAFGPMAGGTSVSLLGSGFTGASQVLFGSIAATGVSVLDDSHLTATAPAQAGGSVDVTVTTPAGISAVSSGASFQYVAVGPAVTSLGTTSGPTAGGTAVTINGSNLLGTTGVSFGSTPAVFFQVLSDSQIKAISPLAVAGAVQVTVTTPDGTAPTGSSTTFTYTVDPSATPTVTGLSQSSGPSSGGTTLTVTGTNLAGTSQVLFGQTPATFVLLSSTSPAGDAFSPFILLRHSVGCMSFDAETTVQEGGCDNSAKMREWACRKGVGPCTLQLSHLNEQKTRFFHNAPRSTTSRAGAVLQENRFVFGGCGPSPEGRGISMNPVRKSVR